MSKINYNRHYPGREDTQEDCISSVAGLDTINAPEIILSWEQNLSENLRGQCQPFQHGTEMSTLSRLDLQADGHVRDALRTILNDTPTLLLSQLSLMYLSS